MLDVQSILFLLDFWPVREYSVESVVIHVENQLILNVEQKKVLAVKVDIGRRGA